MTELYKAFIDMHVI